MPPICNKKIQKNIIKQEGLKEQAIHDLKNQKISSIAKAAKIYGIPYVSLYDCKQGALPHTEVNSKKKKLIISKEEVFIQRILSLNK